MSKKTESAGSIDVMACRYYLCVQKMLVHQAAFLLSVAACVCDFFNSARYMRQESILMYYASDLMYYAWYNT